MIYQFENHILILSQIFNNLNLFSIDHNDRIQDDNQLSNSTAFDDQKNDKDISKDDEKETDELFQKHVTFDILSPVPFINDTENGFPYEPLNSMKNADNASVDEDIGNDFYDNLEGMTTIKCENYSLQMFNVAHFK